MRNVCEKVQNTLMELIYVIEMGLQFIYLYIYINLLFLSYHYHYLPTLNFKVIFINKKNYQQKKRGTNCGGKNERTRACSS